MKVRKVKAADLFCGAGGTSTGLAMACAQLGIALLFCAKCFNVLLQGGCGGYIYGIQNGQKLRMINGEEAA